ncbi:diaminopimelate epimerase [Halovivax limisalsi]|uniref:diaminopimelate epimerase n=1 Tax=Halovivax limisalsi TaxID=1453760 RepID=UPI001FFDE806|nr:diaminopimelate epimerase [Halovivax limisalsi]
MSSIAADDATVPVAKYHGTGNDFVVVDAAESIPDRRAFARRVCDRSDGLGADGVLFLALEPDYRPPRVVMTLVQPDGSTAPMCGNGARCAAAWAMTRTGADAVMVDTQSGSRRAERVALADGEDLTVDGPADGPLEAVADGEPPNATTADGPPDAISVEMGEPAFEPAAVPVRADGPVVERPLSELGLDGAEAAVDPEGTSELPASHPVTLVNTGVPHAIVFVDDVASVDLTTLGPAIRHADAFPRGTNVTIASLDVGRATDDHPVFAQRTYERGVEGETDACGTGAVAIAAAAAETGRTETGVPVSVHPPGGDLRVAFDDLGRAVLAGPVVREFTTDLSVLGAQ